MVRVWMSLHIILLLENSIVLPREHEREKGKWYLNIITKIALPSGILEKDLNTQGSSDTLYELLVYTNKEKARICIPITLTFKLGLYLFCILSS